VNKVLVVCAALFVAGCGAQSEERILSWHSLIVVEKSGDLLVTETIKVRAAGRAIKRGILRDLPLLFDAESKPPTKDLDQALKKPIGVVSVKRNGEREHYGVENNGDRVTVRIGRREVFLKPGIYTYEITYRTGRQLSHDEGRDAVYWNVNGTGWSFPIDEMSATVTLPAGIKGTKIRGYTGKLNEKGEDYRAELTETGATIASTRPFDPKENLSLVLEWPPGLLDAAAYGK